MGAAAIPLITAAIGAGTAIYTGQQEQKAANVQAKSAEAQGEYERKQAEADAATEKQAAEIRASKIREAGRAQRASVRAGAAASGMDVGFGTAVDLQTTVTEQAEQDAQMSIFGGLDAFRRGQQTGQSLQIRGQNEGIALRNQGSASMTQGFIGAGKAIGSGYQEYQDRQDKKV